MPVKMMSGLGPATRGPPASPSGWPLRGQRVVWVYAITDDLGPDQFAGLAGVGGERVRTVAEADLTAVVGSVEARAFGEDALASLLDGLDNIERVGRAHHQVIARAAAGGPRSCRSGWPPSIPTTTRSVPCWPGAVVNSPACWPASGTRWNGESRSTGRPISRTAPTHSRTRSTGSWRTSPTPPSGSPTWTRATCKARSR